MNWEEQAVHIQKIATEKRDASADTRAYTFPLREHAVVCIDAPALAMIERYCLNDYYFWEVVRRSAQKREHFAAGPIRREQVIEAIATMQLCAARSSLSSCFERPVEQLTPTEVAKMVSHGYILVDEQEDSREGSRLVVNPLYKPPVGVEQLIVREYIRLANETL